MKMCENCQNLVDYCPYCEISLADDCGTDEAVLATISLQTQVDYLMKALEAANERAKTAEDAAKQSAYIVQEGSTLKVDNVNIGFIFVDSGGTLDMRHGQANTVTIGNDLVGGFLGRKGSDSEHSRKD